MYESENLALLERIRKRVWASSERGVGCRDYGLIRDYFEMLRIYEAEDFKRAHRWNREVKRLCAQGVRNDGLALSAREAFYHLNKRALFFDARLDFDSFLQYLEYDREPGKRLYLPRRHTLVPVIRGFQEVADGKLDLLTVSQPKRTAKALPLETQVMTPDGFVAIGALRVGDVVTGADGKPTRVTGVYPQGALEVYEIDFTETGKSPLVTTVECCRDHLWTVRTEEDRAKGASRVLSCGEMLEGTMKRGGDRHNNYSVDYVLPVELTARGERLIAPYTMGVLLGDGSFCNGAVRLSNPEPDIVERVREELPVSVALNQVGGTEIEYGVANREREHNARGHLLKNAVQEALIVYGLSGLRSYEKFIPEPYLYASIPERLALMQGLFDTDGHVNSQAVHFSTSSKRLAEDVAFLVTSLGGRCRTTESMGRYKKNGVRKTTRMSYRVYCQFPNTIMPLWCERKREKYKPKRQRLMRFVNDIRATGRFKEMVCITVDNADELFVVGDRMIPTHNTSIGLLFVLWQAGKAPLGSSVCSGAGNDLVKSFYAGCLDTLYSDEYLYHDVFPDAKVAGTNADEKTIHLSKKKRFATITCRSIDGQITGSTEATRDGVLYIDDLVPDDEVANNRDRLDKLWDKARGDLLGRRLEGCPIVAQGTRYSIYDPIGRLQEVAPTMGWRMRVVEIPALDPITDESNFEIMLHGKPAFTTAYYRRERELVSDVQWASQFQQEPYEAKGRMFPEDLLNRYFELPVTVDPDAVISVCDTAESGDDSVMMPVAYVYGEDVFIHDCVFDNSPPMATKPQCAKKLIEHSVSTATFESNNAGEYYARDVGDLVHEMGGKVSIRTKRTISNKHTRIENASDGIIKHFFFKDKSLYTPQSQYGQMMRELTTYTRTGKSKHDDAPDGLSLLENEIRNLSLQKVEIVKRHF